MENASKNETTGATKAVNRRATWMATASMFAGLSAWLLASYWLPQGPLGWLFGWKAPSPTESKCIGLFKSPLCYFSEQAVAQITPTKTWVVVDIKLADGSTGSMAFDNRPGSDVSAEACRSALPALAGILRERASEALKTTTFHITGMKCVESPTDPLNQKVQN